MFGVDRRRQGRWTCRPTVRWLLFAVALLLITGPFLFSLFRPPRLAVATLLTSDGYARAATVLVTSLRQHSELKNVDFVLLVTATVSPGVRDALKAVGWTHLRLVKPLAAPAKGTAARGDVIPTRFLDTYTKLRVWTLEGYDKVLMMDADTLCIGSLRALFQETVPYGGLLAVPDCCDRFNSGVMLLTPSLATFSAFLADLDLPSYDGGDQGFLNSYFKSAWRRLDYVYNAQLPDFVDLPAAWPDLSTIRIIHYERYKPWKDDWKSAKVRGLEDVMNQWKRVEEEQ